MIGRVAAWVGAGLAAGSALAPAVAAQEVRFETGVEGGGADVLTLHPREPLVIALSHTPPPGEGRVAVFVGEADLSALFVAAADRLTYDGSVVPLPAGETEVSVYLVSPAGDWMRIGSTRVRVAEAGPAPATDTAELRPGDAAAADPPPAAARSTDFRTLLPRAALSLNLNASAGGERSRAQGSRSQSRLSAATLQSSIENGFVHDGVRVQSRFELAGASREEEALRFREKGARAPQIDLSSYSMRLEAGRAALNAGHLSFGAQRHLINGFGSRGLTLRLPAHPRFDLSLAAMNGSSIVGFGNFLGLERADHRVLSGAAGLELLPQRPGELRVEFTALSGSLLPRSGFGQGSVPDAEESRGYGVRLRAGGAANRFRVDGGWTTSTFTNPADPLLERDSLVVAVEETTNHARYLDAELRLLRNLPLTGTRSANLELGFRHERVDPLFRSVAASLQADRLENQLSLNGSFGEILWSASHARSQNNLDEVASLLTTSTRRTGLNVGVPLASLLGAGGRPAAWLPSLTYGLDRTHQFAESIPENGGFADLSFVPDQVATSQSAAATWQNRRWRIGYQLNRSLQDNRQPGRERADLDNRVHGLALGLAAGEMLDLGLDLGVESAANREREVRDETRRLGGSLSWRSRATSLAANLAHTTSELSDGASRRTASTLNLQCSRRFGLLGRGPRRVGGQLFLRATGRVQRSENRTLEVNDRVRSWTVSAGTSLTLP